MKQINHGRVDNINTNNYYDWQLFNERRNMRKIIEKNIAIIIILTIFTIAFSSCGSIRMGDYNAWEHTYGSKNCTNNW